MGAENAVRWIEMKMERARAAGSGVRPCGTGEKGEKRRTRGEFQSERQTERLKGGGEADCGSCKGHRMNV